MSCEQSFSGFFLDCQENSVNLEGARFWDLTTPPSRSICGHPCRIWSLTHKNKVFLHSKIDQKKYYLDLQHHFKSVQMRFVQKRVWPLMNLYQKKEMLRSSVDVEKRPLFDIFFFCTFYLDLITLRNECYNKG